VKFISTPARGFIFGFLCALLLIGAVKLASLRFFGGQGAYSPDGKYTVSVYAPLRRASGDPWSVRLEDRATETVLRRVEIGWSNGETPPYLRGDSSVVRWSPASDYADILLGDKPAVRVFVP
jgi:hypothetical protein